MVYTAARCTLSPAVPAPYARDGARPSPPVCPARRVALKPLSHRLDDLVLGRLAEAVQDVLHGRHDCLLSLRETAATGAGRRGHTLPVAAGVVQQN